MSTITLGITVALLLAYGGTLVYFRVRQASRPPTRNASQPFVSVVVVARNEQGTIGTCVQSLQAQTYPSDRYEIIVVDDHSTDSTGTIVAHLAEAHANVWLLSLADYPPAKKTVAHKKMALTYAIEQARGERIVITDADCIVPTSWLTTLVEIPGDFWIAPVEIGSATDLLSAFQALDMAGVMALTMGSAQRDSPLLCNGANLAFRRHLFFRVGGYTGIDHLPSGDDVLLLQQVKKRNSVTIVPVTASAARVQTQPVSTWRGLWQQRLRWAGKTGAYQDTRLLWVQGITFVLCWWLLLLVMGTSIGYWALVGSVITGWLGKALLDYYWLRRATHLFGDRMAMRWFASAFLLHTLYVAVIGLAALLPHRTVWKGRVVRKG